jgi:L-lactate dehydrogenase complex protein LldG
VDEGLVAEFIREAKAAGAGTYRASESEVADRLVELLKDDRSVVIAAGLEGIAGELRSRGVKIVCEDGSDDAAEALPGADAGLGRALGGVAASGTILIGPGSGLEGLVSILPPHYVALLPAAAIQRDIAASLAGATPLIATPGSRIAFVTGPSRTSDIELTPVIGVHGPIRLDLVIVDE